MKVEPHATFRFVFRGINSKNESFNRLKAFLLDREWLSTDSDSNYVTLSYHTENNGVCEVTLKEIDDTSVENRADSFFSDLCSSEDVKWVIVLYNNDTDKLIQNYSGKYFKRQTVELYDLKENDEVIILYRK